MSEGATGNLAIQQLCLPMSGGATGSKLLAVQQAVARGLVNFVAFMCSSSGLSLDSKNESREGFSLESRWYINSAAQIGRQKMPINTIPDVLRYCPEVAT